MLTVSAGTLLMAAVFVLLAVAAGTIAARIFMAASRPRPSGPGANEKV